MSAAPQQPSPFAGFFQNVGNVINNARNGANNLVQQVQNNPVVQGAEQVIQQGGQEMAHGAPVNQAIVDMAGNAVNKMSGGQMGNSPMGQFVQGKFGNVIPAAKQELADLQSGKYKPQINFGGEMEETPGMGLTTGEATGTGASEYPYAKPAKISQSEAQQNQGIRQIRYKGSGTAPQKEANANATLDRLGIKGDANTQLGMFQQAKNNIYNWIKNTSSMAKNEVQIPIQEVKDAVTQQVKQEFGSKLSPSELDKVVTDQMNNINDRAMQDQQKPPQAQGQGTVNPYFNNTSDANPSTITGQPVMGKYTAPPSDFIPGKTGPQIKSAAINSPAQEATLNFTPPPAQSAQPKFAYNNEATTTMPNQPNAAGQQPTTIGSRSLYNMKVAANNTPEVNNAFSKITAGNRADLTDEEKTALAGRTALDNVLTKYHPDVKQATNDLSVLNDKRVINSVEGARFKQPAPPPSLGDKVKTLLKNPLIDAGLGVAGFEGVKSIPAVVSTIGKGAMALSDHILHPSQNQGNGANQNNPFKNPPQTNNNNEDNNINHGQSVAQSPFDVKPDQKGDYQLSQQTQPTGTYMTQDMRQQLEQNLAPGSVQFQKIEQRYNDDQAKAKQLLGSATNFLQQLPTTFATGQQVKADFAQIPPAFWHSGQIKDLEAYASDPQHPMAQVLSDISSLNDAYKQAYQELSDKKVLPEQDQLISMSDSPQQAYQKWTRMMQYIVYNHDHLNDAFLSTISSTGTENAQGKPISAPLPATKTSSGVMAPSMLQDATQ